MCDLALPHVLFYVAIWAKNATTALSGAPSLMCIDQGFKNWDGL